MQLKHKTIKFELLTEVACFAYIAGKKNTKDIKKETRIHKTLKIIDWVEWSFFKMRIRNPIIVKQ